MSSPSNPSSPRKLVPPEAGFLVGNPVTPVSDPGSLPPTAMASAPLMTDLPGYEDASYDKQTVPPPSYYSLPDITPNSRDPIVMRNTLTAEEVMDLLTQHVSSKCCWGTGALKHLVITDIQMSSSYQYHLETMSEKRECSWAHEPHNPSNVLNFAVSPHGASAPPPPWAIPVTPSAMFTDGETKVEVPFTSTVRQCHVCVGCGRTRCTSCAGMGFSPCTFCHGSGQRTGDSAAAGQCLSCNATGRRRCLQCNASGHVKCSTCDTFGNLRYFLQLHVTWTCHKEDFVSDATGLKEKYIKKNEGEIVAQEEGHRVFPFPNFPDKSIPEASRTLLEKHDKQAINVERIIRQKHNIKEVSIALIYYKLNEDKDGVFYVFGKEDRREVYFPKYPNRCCYCCSII